MFVSGYDGMLFEVVVGLFDDVMFEVCICVEVEEEIGYCVCGVCKVFEVFMSLGFVIEKLYFFVGEYDVLLCIGVGGGVVVEGEDLEVVEMLL